MLLDCGSAHSFVTGRLARQLGAPVLPFDGAISGMGCAPVPVEGVVHCHLHPASFEGEPLSVSALVVPQITTPLPSSRVSVPAMLELTGLKLADPQFHTPDTVDFLAGIDIYNQVIVDAPFRLGNSSLFAQPTVFGVVLTGSASQNYAGAAREALISRNDRLAEAFKAFCEVEDPAPADRSNPEDSLCERLFTQTLTRTSEGRYIVRLPLRPGRSSPGNNRQVALKRFLGVERKLSRDTDLRQRYRQFMAEYESLGHMSPAATESEYIIPHHGLMQGEKLRVVFDASCDSTGCSLNDMLYTGPKLQSDLPEILIRFRTHPIALTSDIVKMYRQVLVHPDDRRLQHIFWRSEPSEPITEYELNTVTYGVRSSAFQAIRAVQQAVRDHGEQFPAAAQHIMSAMYVDDLVSGADSVEEALTLRRELTELLQKAGFELAKWGSNHPQVAPERATPSPLCLAPKSEEPVKILGLAWCSQRDVFQFILRDPRPKLTKRGMMSLIARLFDPLGFVAPVIFMAKTLLQEAWKEGLDWDTPLPSALSESWLALTREWNLLEHIRVPRYINAAGAECRIVGFCDASTLGYAAAVYARLTSPDGAVQTFLIAAKTKVAPKKFLSVAQLELCGALLLARTISSLSSTIPRAHGPPLFYTDSTVVLAWLQTPFHLLKVFEANRISAILTRSCREQWHHVRSADNPADCASRGRLPSQLSREQCWWVGPPWLSEPTWSIPSAMPALLSTKTPNPDLSSEWMSRFSSLQRLIGSVAWILRWVDRHRSPDRVTAEFITAPERTRALLRCVRQAQRSNFTSSKSIHSPEHQSLRPFQDENGIIRVGGRLEHSTVPYEHKHPALLPRRHHLALLIIRDLHECHFHAGPTLTVALLRCHFWIPGALRVVKKLIHECIKCRILLARPASTRMGALPAERLQGGRAFARVGVDFAGPLLIKESRSRGARISKTYACIFVCLASKAIHIELVASLTTIAFLEALDRFIARRGLPALIESDHGKNFIGASRFIRSVYTNTRKQESCIEDHLAPRGVQWKFIPPRSPHFGGLWEAAIKSMKRLLANAIGPQPSTFNELNTILVRIEGLLNSRPLCPVRDDPSDRDFITPAHLIIGAPLHVIPWDNVSPSSVRAHWKGMRQRIETVWKKWSREYLHHLQQLNGREKHGPNLGVGDLVILIEKKSTPGVWPVARITEVHPGSDGHVRVITVRTASGQLLKRAVRGIAPLLTSGE